MLAFGMVILNVAPFPLPLLAAEALHPWMAEMLETR